MNLKATLGVAIIACGIMVCGALMARELLAQKGISVAVIDMHTIKPLDEDAVAALANSCGAIVTAENHNAAGGPGRAWGCLSNSARWEHWAICKGNSV